MSALSGAQEAAALGEEAGAARDRDREQVKRRLVQIAAQRAPRAVDVERAARKLSMTPSQVRRVLSHLAEVGQLERPPDGFHAVRSDRHAPRVFPRRDTSAGDLRSLRLDKRQRAVVDLLSVRASVPRFRVRAETKVDDAVIADLITRGVVRARQVLLTLPPGARETFGGLS